MKQVSCRNRSNYQNHTNRNAIGGCLPGYPTNESYERQQFSFNKNLKGPHSPLVQDKYSSLYNDLLSMDHDDLVELLLEEINENEKNKLQLSVNANRIHSMEEELSSFREALKTKREAIQILCDTESRNLQLIEKLEVKLSKRSDVMKDTYYENKYQELSIYMNEYIRSINEAQEEFKRVYQYYKNYNQRLEKQVEGLNRETVQAIKSQQMLAQQSKKLHQEINDLSEKNRTLESTAGFLREENEIIRKQIEVYQENIRMTDRLESHFCNENQQLSSQLDFIKEKINENQHISKDIIERLEESSSNCEKMVKVKEQLSQCLLREKEKSKELEREILLLRKKCSTLESELRKSEEEHGDITKQREDWEACYIQQKAEKQGFKRQLLCLADKVRLMESTYKKQLEQNEKIKEELSRFWDKKERKDSSITVETHKHALGELRNNNRSVNVSESIFSNSDNKDPKTKFRKLSDQPDLDQKENHNSSVIRY